MRNWKAHRDAGQDERDAEQAERDAGRAEQRMPALDASQLPNRAQMRAMLAQAQASADADGDFEVDVETHYIEAKSDPAEPRHVFAYTITVANRSTGAAQLRSRHWLITNGDGAQQEVHGPGVVGQQPRIAPGQAFRYTSACVLETPVGVMQGRYEFVSDSGDAFNVAVAPFSLAAPNAVH